MEAFFVWLGEFFKSLLGEQKVFTEIGRIPRKGDTSTDVVILQKAINNYLKKQILKSDGVFGALTEAQISNIQKANQLAGSGIIGLTTLSILGLVLKQEKIKKTDKLEQAKWVSILAAHKGKPETNAAFQNYMNTYWKKSGLDFKGLVGSARAWCGVFIFMGMYVAGYMTPKNSFRAISWDGWGHSINWKVDGFPQGAVIRINSKGDCKSASGNHLTTANGYCTSASLNKVGATYGGLGGNQANSVKVSIYKASTICYVGWPKELPKPSKVLKDIKCTGLGATNESTR